jgi:hypothetical protein
MKKYVETPKAEVEEPVEEETQEIIQETTEAVETEAKTEETVEIVTTDIAPPVTSLSEEAPSKKPKRRRAKPS